MAGGRAQEAHGALLEPDGADPTQVDSDGPFRRPRDGVFEFRIVRLLECLFQYFAKVRIEALAISAGEDFEFAALHGIVKVR